MGHTNIVQVKDADNKGEKGPHYGTPPGSGSTQRIRIQDPGSSIRIQIYNFSSFYLKLQEKRELVAE